MGAGGWSVNSLNQLHGRRGLLPLPLRRGRRITSAKHFDSTSPPQRDTTTANGPVFRGGTSSANFCNSGCSDSYHSCAWRARPSVTEQPGNLYIAYLNGPSALFSCCWWPDYAWNLFRSSLNVWFSTRLLDNLTLNEKCFQSSFPVAAFAKVGLKLD